MSMSLFMRHALGGPGGRRIGPKLMAAVSIAGLCAVALAAQIHGQAQNRPTPPFTLASLQGDYAYSNSVSNVASYGFLHFDGQGGLSTDGIRVNRECLGCPSYREIIDLGPGIGTYTMESDGKGVITIDYAFASYTYEFVVTRAVELGRNRRLAINLFSAGTIGGLAGQLFAPTLSRLVVPRGSARR